MSLRGTIADRTSDPRVLTQQHTQHTIKYLITRYITTFIFNTLDSFSVVYHTSYSYVQHTLIFNRSKVYPAVYCVFISLFVKKILINAGHVFLTSFANFISSEYIDSFSLLVALTTSNLISYNFPPSSIMVRLCFGL